jgi:hypothetical protein
MRPATDIANDRRRNRFIAGLLALSAVVRIAAELYYGSNLAAGAAAAD